MNYAWLGGAGEVGKITDCMCCLQILPMTCPKPASFHMLYPGIN